MFFVFIAGTEILTIKKNLLGLPEGETESETERPDECARRVIGKLSLVHSLGHFEEYTEPLPIHDGACRVFCFPCASMGNFSDRIIWSDVRSINPYDHEPLIVSLEQWIKRHLRKEYVWVR